MKLTYILIRRFWSACFFFHNESYFLINFSKSFAFSWSSNIVTSLYNLISIVFQFDLRPTVFLIKRWLILNTDFIDDFEFRKWFFENFDSVFSDSNHLIRYNVFSHQWQWLSDDTQFLFDNFFFYIQLMCSIEHA